MKKDKKDYILTMNGKEFEVPPGGTLGVLALGNVGVRAWKASKKKWEEKNKNGKK